MAELFNAILAEEHSPIVAAVDGKTACQTRDENGDPIHMLNVFVHDVRVNLIQWSVRGDKTNEPGCLKAHADELFAQYPLIRLLTGHLPYRRMELPLRCANSLPMVAGVEQAEQRGAVFRGRRLPPGRQVPRKYRDWKKSGYDWYELKTKVNKKEKKTWFHVCVRCKNRNGERGKKGRKAYIFAFYGVTPGRVRWFFETYRKWFGIETSYRQMHECRI